MADDKPKKVKVEALKYHTNAGEAYDVGDTYDVDESAVESLGTMGFAVRVDRVAVAKAATKAAATPAKAGKAKITGKKRGR